MDRVSKAERELVRKMQRQTNADRIRSMSGEELATWIDHIQADAYEHGMMETPVTDYPNIYSGWLDWLRAEEKE